MKLNLESGTLWQNILDRTERALKKGVLRPISTESDFLEDGGVEFLVRIVSNLERKAEEKKSKGIQGHAGKKKPNPFLPYEKEMFVSDISDTHVCLLNKFNVIDHHLLVVTRAFEDQETLLTMRDFEAICRCMAEFEGLAFYNGGEEAGASQEHKHLQMIPLPMTEDRFNIPMEILFDTIGLERHLSVVPGLPFVHSYARFPSDLSCDFSKAAEISFDLYRHMLQAVGLNPFKAPERSLQTGPYNLLFTRQWMLLVPRSREFFESMSVNALGFAGALLVQNKHQMQILKEKGGMAVLKHTAINY